MSLEARITELESRLAFQDDTIQALNDELVGQQRIVERLQQQFLLLARRQEEMSHRVDGLDDEAPPPHY
ncbi:SlyX family protein [Pseudomonas sp. 21LCFQ02]|uniref:SlyX family protein n=1 Tax=unclassified Pseudomonas TaxID=196821 RepID=UPI0004F79C98|nr:MULTISPECIES: SlyX family protein [unclassified Pseudomonas]MCO8163247.1 SlyX family protein [Pseudomonas sp. 21LCFQ010]MCO8166266.1 SlyX family protein [Pseudomonas sp. 21LCFQ02]MCQ9422758.1 SlyX family protein [Pseudomonas sp. LJDD11]BAP43957.1 SlyX family protein [Pseudomonas sp. StFLB209]